MNRGSSRYYVGPVKLIRNSAGLRIEFLIGRDWRRARFWDFVGKKIRIFQYFCDNEAFLLASGSDNCNFFSFGFWNNFKWTKLAKVAVIDFLLVVVCHCSSIIFFAFIDEEGFLRMERERFSIQSFEEVWLKNCYVGGAFFYICHSLLRRIRHTLIYIHDE